MRDVTLLSLRIRPLGMAELLMVRFLACVAADVPALFRTVSRVRFLRHALGTSLGFRAERGMAAAEVALLFLLVSRAAGSPEEVRLKTSLVRDTYPHPDGNVGAMLAAGLEADARRLGLLAAPERIHHAGNALRH